jgi:RNA polymerase sigma-70 factor (ECF subfamily)
MASTSSKADQSLCDETVYNSVYLDNAEKLRNLLYYKCGDLNQAEDLVQEAFIKLWNKCAEVVHEKVGGFLYTVATHLFLDQVRSKKVSLKFEKTLVDQTEHEDPYFQLRSDEFRGKIEEAISSLPEGQREAFLLNRIDKLTYKQIAEQLNISQTAVEKRISKALTKLRLLIKELENFSI